MLRRAWYSSSLRGTSRMASTPLFPEGTCGNDQGVSWVAVAARISCRMLGDWEKAGWAPGRSGENPGKRPLCPGCLASSGLHWCAFSTLTCWIQGVTPATLMAILFNSVQSFSCLTLCDSMNRSMPGLPVYHQLLEFTQTHVHRVSDAIQPSHPLLSPSPPAPNPSQHQSLFQ